MTTTMIVPALAAIAFATEASQSPNFAGTYRCEIASKRCEFAGST
jgi:hypothetical protein